MLRGEHVMARNVRGELSPHRLSAKDKRTMEVAEALVEAYGSHVGRPRSLLAEKLSALEEEFGPRLDPRRGFKVARALSKLLEELC